MKFKFAVFILVVNTLVIAQSKQNISLAFLGGVIFPVDDHKLRGGLNLGADLEARSNKFGVYITITNNFCKELEDVYNPNSSRKNVNILEIYGGPRWYIGNLKKVNGAIEAGLGYYNYHSHGSMGINIGMGLNYPLNQNFDVNLKSKSHLFAENYVLLNLGLYLGIRYKFR